VNARALKGVIAPRAMGRNLVLLTWGSRLRSQRSLIEQPAPRMIRAPLKKSKEVLMTESGVAIGIANGAARRVENKQGKNR
jgi:hypothetical protein